VNKESDAGGVFQLEREASKKNCGMNRVCKQYGKKAATTGLLLKIQKGGGDRNGNAIKRGPLIKGGGKSRKNQELSGATTGCTRGENEKVSGGGRGKLAVKFKRNGNSYSGENPREPRGRFQAKIEGGGCYYKGLGGGGTRVSGRTCLYNNAGGTAEQANRCGGEKNDFQSRRERGGKEKPDNPV